MDTERKYPTREVDGVDVPQMGIKELIKQEVLQRHNQLSYQDD